MNVIERFDLFFENFRQTDMWKAMVNERENSPWHREANVARHTEMLIEWYKENLLSNRNEFQQILTLTACLMHDIGKPSSRVPKERDGQIVNGYHGHESVSAGMWRNFALGNEDVKNILLFDVDAISFVSLMIEHHVPFGLKKHQKRVTLKTAMHARFGEIGHRAWLDLLLSDQFGRISDDKEEKLANVRQWMIEWEDIQC